MIDSNIREVIRQQKRIRRIIIDEVLWWRIVGEPSTLSQATKLKFQLEFDLFELNIDLSLSRLGWPKSTLNWYEPNCHFEILLDLLVIYNKMRKQKYLKSQNLSWGYCKKSSQKRRQEEIHIPFGKTESRQRRRQARQTRREKRSD